jgi:hypothetical protein
MQLDSLEFSGYKSFPGGDTDDSPRQSLDLAPLTLLFGKNNSGKSAVARLPRLLLGGLACNDERILPLEVRGLKYGGRFVDLIHGGDFFRRPAFRVRGHLEHELLDLSLALYSRGALAEDEPPVIWSYEMITPEKLQILASSTPEQQRAFSGLLPTDERWDRWRRAAATALDRMIHLGPMRAPIEASYPEERPSLLGFDGAEAPQWLRADAELADQVGDWFAQHMDGWRLAVSRSSDSFSLRILKSRSMTTNLARAGEGLQQVLPVVLHQFWRQRTSDDPFLDVVEQPELHLHDAAQAPLADLFIKTALQETGRVVVETHSEPLLLRVQRRVAEGAIPPDRIALYFVDVTSEGSELRKVELNSDGEVDWWPEGVFEEDFQEVAAIRRAQRRGANSGHSR